MTLLQLHGREITTVFGLLGEKENDLTFALGWVLARSDRLAASMLNDFAAEIKLSDIGSLETVNLQEYLPDTGYTDVELRTNQMHVIIEAKRGLDLPDEAQIAKYAKHLRIDLAGAIVVISEAPPPFAARRLPASLKDSQGRKVPVLYRSWEQILKLAQQARQGSGLHERRLLDEFSDYLKGLIAMRDLRSNMVYVVSIGQGPVEWAPCTPLEIVRDLGLYFHPIGGKGRWPVEPPTFIGFRWNGVLQSIHFIESWSVIDSKPSEQIKGTEWKKYRWDEPHYLYTLGPAIHPDHEVRGGTITRGNRAWASLDLLLTCDTISDANHKTFERLGSE